jgi:hypothetical protein
VPYLTPLVASFPPRQPGFDLSSNHVEFMMENVVLEQVFSDYFGFPCQFSFHRLFYTQLSSGAGTTGQLVADVPSELSLTTLRKIKINNKKLPGT